MTGESHRNQGELEEEDRNELVEWLRREHSRQHVDGEGGQKKSGMIGEGRVCGEEDANELRVDGLEMIDDRVVLRVPVSKPDGGSEGDDRKDTTVEEANACLGRKRRVIPEEGGEIRELLKSSST